MNGELAQALAIALHGTAWLADTSQPIPDLEATSTYQYTSSVRFTDPRQISSTSSVHATTGDWLLGLASAGTSRIWLASSGPSWAVATEGSNGPIAWPATWELGDPDRADARIWAVTYEAHPAQPRWIERPDVAGAQAELAAALVATEAFAAHHGEDHWAEWFRAARAALDDPAPVAKYHDDLLPPVLPLQRRRLASGAIGAWAFGGMGSWNDIWLADDSAMATYEAVTARLYDAVLRAFTAAVNG